MRSGVIIKRYIVNILIWMVFIPVISFSAHAEDAGQLTPEEKEFVRSHSQIVLGAGASFEPFIIQNSDGSFGGFDVDVIQKVEAYTGLDIRLELGVWSEVQVKAKKREIDGLVTATVNEERAKLYNHSLPYVQFTNLVIVKKNNPRAIFKPSDLSGKVVALQQGNEHFIKIYKNLDHNVRAVYFETIHDVLRAVVAGDVDFTILDETAPYVASKIGLGENVEAAFPVGEPYDLVFMLRNDWPELVSIINKGLRSIDEKEQIRMRDLWFGSINNSFNYNLLFKFFIFITLIIGVILYWVSLVSG